jgi:hypothetical protein
MLSSENDNKIEFDVRHYVCAYFVGIPNRIHTWQTASTFNVKR